MCHVSCVMCHVSCVMFHVSCVMCHVSSVSLMPTATATDPPSANFPIIHSRLVCKGSQTKIIATAKTKMSSGMPIFAIFTLFD